MKRRSLLISGLLAFAAMASLAAAKPNFSGDWKLNVDKSDFGPMPPPTSQTMKIQHDDPNLKVTTQRSSAQGDDTNDAKYTTDGKEAVNTIQGQETKTTANWDGDNLVMNTKLDFQGNAITISRKWTMSEDGKSLTDAMHITSPQGEFDIKQVYDKQ